MGTTELGKAWADVLWDLRSDAAFPGDSAEAVEVIEDHGSMFGVELDGDERRQAEIVNEVLVAAQRHWEVQWQMVGLRSKWSTK